MGIMNALDLKIITWINHIVVATRDPMDILRIELSDMDQRKMAKQYGVPRLYDIFLTGFLMLGIVVIMISLIALLFVHKSETVAEKKSDILHKLFVVFVLSSLATILSCIGMFFSGIL